MPQPERIDVNIFKPRGSAMKGETRLIALVLAGWLLAIAGSQGVAFFLEYTLAGADLSRWTLFNLPLSFWLTGQFLPLWFIILCVIFNIWMDRHAARDLDGVMRFRVRGAGEGEE